ncbi:MAG: hypothetical protein AB7F86_06335 [Bdellovibrionales bacterium]
MQLPKDRLRLLELLAEELMKERPQESFVASALKAAGLPDTKDPMDRINKVLVALHFHEGQKEFN